MPARCSTPVRSAAYSAGAATAHGAAAASARPIGAARARIGGGSGRGGTADRPSDVSIVERAGWDLAKDTGGLALLEKPQGDGDGAGARGGGGGPWRLLLLDAPSHTEGRVVAGLCQTVANVDEAHARNVFATSKQLGLALVVSCLREHAEHYRSQLYLRGLKTAIEPDNSA